MKVRHVLSNEGERNFCSSCEWFAHPPSEGNRFAWFWYDNYRNIKVCPHCGEKTTKIVGSFIIKKTKRFLRSEKSEVVGLKTKDHGEIFLPILPETEQNYEMPPVKPIIDQSENFASGLENTLTNIKNTKNIIAKHKTLSKNHKVTADEIFRNCRVVFYPGDGKYPIEHSLRCGKDQRHFIESHIRGLRAE